MFVLALALLLILIGGYVVVRVAMTEFVKRGRTR